MQIGDPARIHNRIIIRKARVAYSGRWTSAEDAELTDQGGNCRKHANEVVAGKCGKIGQLYRWFQAERKKSVYWLIGTIHRHRPDQVPAGAAGRKTKTMLKDAIKYRRRDDWVAVAALVPGRKGSVGTDGTIHFSIDHAVT
jgi:hypothetical protein